MGYVEQNCLSQNEHVVLNVEKSRIFLIWSWVFGILFCWLLFIPTISAIIETVRYNTTEYVVTDTKVVEKYGLVSVHCDQMNLNKIENITINIGFWGRIFGFGTLVIQGANNNNVYFTDICEPEQVRNEINEMISRQINNMQKTAI